MERGLKVHQSRKKCSAEHSKGPRIDRYVIRGRTNQSGEVQGQEKHHSPQGIRTSAEPLPGATPLIRESPEPIQPQTAEERKMDRKRPEIL